MIDPLPCQAYVVSYVAAQRTLETIALSQVVLLGMQPVDAHA